MKKLNTKYKILHTIRLRTWVALGTIIVLIPIILFQLFQPNISSAEWFNDAWGYRQPISFTHNAAISAERAVTFSLDTAELITASVMQSDCDDTRFTDGNGKLLKYDLTGTCNNAATTYEIIFPSIINGTNNAYVYYGNPNSSNAEIDSTSYTALTPSGSDPAITDRAAEQKTTGPLSYWALDQGTDNTCIGGTDDVCDATSNNYSGTRTGATWTAEDRCLAGKCLEFDGSDDTVNVGNETLLNFERTSAFSVSFWMRTGSDAAMTIVSKQESTGNFRGWNIQTGTSGYVFVQLASVYSSNTLEVRTTNDQNYDDNKWHHVLATYDGSSGPSGIAIYFDGANQALTTTVNSPLSATIQTTTEVHIGSRNAAAQFYNGFLDEIKIYNYVKTSAQAKAEFASEGIARGVSARFGQQDNAFLNDGLVGYWPMNETSANGCGVSDDNCDYSGNGNHGDWQANATSASGKFGNAVTLDGTGDSLRVPNSSNLDLTNELTYAAWVNFDTVGVGGDNYGNALISKNDGNVSSFRQKSLLLDSGPIIRFHIYNGNNRLYDTSTVSMTAGNWYHVAVSVKDNDFVAIYLNGSQVLYTQLTEDILLTEDEDVTIGSGLSGDVIEDEFDGKIDEARVYNRALSPKEIQALYNWAPGPVGYWKMDEGAVGDRYDSSGNSNTLTESTSDDIDPVQGKFGKGGQFVASSTEYLSIADNATLSAGDVDFTVSSWVFLDSKGANANIITKYNAGANQREYELTYNSSADRFRWNVSSAGTAGTTTSLDADNFGSPSTGTWYFVVGWHDSANNLIGIQVNNTVNTTSYSTGVFDGTADFAIGAIADPGEYWDGKIDEAKIYKYRRTPQQIVEDMNGGHPAGGSPVSSQVVHYSLNEQNGTNVNNLNPTQSAVNATITGAAWKTKEVCKDQGCLDFDGTDDTLIVAFTSATDLNEGLVSGFTIGAWIYPDTAGEGSGGRIWSKGTNTWLRVDTLSGGFLDIQGLMDLATSDASLNVSAKITQSAWNYVAMSWTDDGDDEITIWVNGIAVGISTDGSGAPAAEGSNLTIGQESGATTQTFDGKIDEFKVYSSELTAEQIKIDANFGGVLNFGVGSDEAAQVSGGAGNSPTAYWDFNENTGTSNVNDKSGNGKTGTMNTFAASAWSPGKYGSSLTFDGTSDYVNVTTPGLPTGDFTYEAWVNPSTLTGGTDTLFMAPAAAGTNELNITLDNNIQVILDGAAAISGATDVTEKVWSHIAITRSGSSVSIYLNGYVDGTGTSSATLDFSTCDFLIGVDADSCTATFGEYFRGRIDDVKFYNYARSAAQVAYDFNRGGPVGWWRMDEGASGNGQTLNDNSGNSLNLTTDDGANNTGMDCTVSGKFNKGCDLDGTDDFMSRADNSILDQTSSFTLSAWVDFDNTSTDHYIIEKGVAAGAANYYLWWNNTAASPATSLFCGFHDGSAFRDHTYTWTPTVDTWYHLACVFDNTNDLFKIYIDGREVASTSQTNTPASDAGSLYVGSSRNASFYHNGQVDDVRIYNYNLSAAQVRKLYDDNSGARFGPSSGTP